MKILLLTHARPFNDQEIVSGNSIRAYYLAKGLLENDMEVVHCYPAQLDEGNESNQVEYICPVKPYSSSIELKKVIKSVNPTVILVGYWELIFELDEDLKIPIVLDVVAPRILETLFEDLKQLDEEVYHTLNAYRRADYFLVGNERQKSFLVSWLILAGIDCKHHIPITVLPISGQTINFSQEKFGENNSLRFVIAGVNWPWRQNYHYITELLSSLEILSPDSNKIGVDLISGNYIYSKNKKETNHKVAKDNPYLKRLDLMPYAEMSNYYQHNNLIGIELAEQNIEREFSQSFRMADFLSHGLPVICSDYLEIANLVTIHNAGWVVKKSQDLHDLISNIINNLNELEKKANNAHQLVGNHFNYQKTIKPLIQFLQNPRFLNKNKAVFLDKLKPVVEEQEKQFIPAVYDYPEKPQNNAAYPFESTIGRWLKSLRKKNDEKKRTIIVVSRGDIFPPVHGAAVKIERTCWALSHHVDQVILVTDNRHHYYCFQQGERIEKLYPLWLTLLAPPNNWVKFRAWRKKIPLSDAFLYYPLVDFSYILRTLYLAIKYPTEVYHAEFPAFLKPVVIARNLLGGKAILVEHNIEYKRLKDQLSDLPDDSYRTLFQVEMKYARAADKVVTVSKLDKQQLINDGLNEAKIEVVPHGVDLNAFNNAKPIDLRKNFGINKDEMVLVYHGIYAYPPNLEAVNLIGEEILPKLHSKNIKVKLLAIGVRPPRKATHPDIVFTGAVDDLAPYLLSADMAVVYLQKGGGTRMKILDYFAAKVPVISTTKGAEGIPIQDGQHLLIADDADATLAAINKLYNEAELTKKLVNNAYNYVKQYDWLAIAERYLELYKS